MLKSIKINRNNVKSYGVFKVLKNLIKFKL